MVYSFENIIAWQKAHAFVLFVYRVTRHFPKDEIFGLTSQFRRAAVSIEANIAEGYKKLSKADKLRFFNISQGSLENQNVKLEVNMKDETVWLNREQLAELFDRDVKTIGKHINNALKEEGM